MFVARWKKKRRKCGVGVQWRRRGNGREMARVLGLDLQEAGEAGGGRQKIDHACRELGPGADAAATLTRTTTATPQDAKALSLAFHLPETLISSYLAWLQVDIEIAGRGPDALAQLRALIRCRAARVW